MPYGATVLFAAGGHGENFFRYRRRLSRGGAHGMETCVRRRAHVAGAGVPTRQAIAFAQEPASWRQGCCCSALLTERDRKVGGAR